MRLRWPIAGAGPAREAGGSLRRSRRGGPGAPSAERGPRGPGDAPGPAVSDGQRAGLPPPGPPARPGKRGLAGQGREAGGGVEFVNTKPCLNGALNRAYRCTSFKELNYPYDRNRL